MIQRDFMGISKNCYDAFQRTLAVVRCFFSRAPAFGASTVITLILTTAPLWAANDLKTKYAELETLKSSRTVTIAQRVARMAVTEKDIDFRLAALDDVAARGIPQVVPQLGALMKDPNATVRQRTARVIGMLGGRPAERELIAALRQEKDVKVKSAILQGLSYCGSADSVAEIRATMKDAQPNVRANGITALGRIPGDASKNTLRDLPDDSDKNVRKLLMETRKKRLKTK